MPWLRTLLFGAGLGLLGMIVGPRLLAEGPQSAPAGPTFRITSNLVFLDVTVVDRKGRPVVTGLTKDDFSVTDDGKPQRIFSFDAPATGAKTVEDAPATVLVLDLLNTPFEDSAFVRYSIRRYLALQPERLISPTELMVLNNKSFDMFHAYTHSRAELMYALEHVPQALPYKLAGDWSDDRLRRCSRSLCRTKVCRDGRTSCGLAVAARAFPWTRLIHDMRSRCAFMHTALRTCWWMHGCRCS
jgi:hypothetical protein